MVQHEDPVLDPLQTEDGQKYKEFKCMYKKEPNESGHPSLKPGSLIDKKRKTYYKIRCILNCHECFKPRCVYSKSKQNVQEKLQIEAIQESHFYLRLSSILPPFRVYLCKRERHM